MFRRFVEMETTADADNEADELLKLNLLMDRYKFYPSHKRCVLAGSITTTNFNMIGSDEQIEIHPGDRALVYYSEENAATAILNVDHHPMPVSVLSLMKRWNALECGNDKCTGWIRSMMPLSITCYFDDSRSPTLPTPKQNLQTKKGRAKNHMISETHDNNNNNNPYICWIWENCTRIIQRTFPESVDITLALEQAKFYSTKLMVMDGTIVHCSLPDFLPAGERCWVHVRSSTKSLLQKLLQSPCVRDDDGQESTIVSKTYDPTGWMQFTQTVQVACRILLPSILPSKETVRIMHSRNPKTGAVLLECTDNVNISISPHDVHSSRYSILHRLGDRSFRRNDGEGYSLPALQDRKERHHIFAKWLVEKFGIEKLSEGSGVLDVAGGKGDLCQALMDLGVRNATLLDPDPRCDIATVKFQVIAKPLIGDGSDLTSHGAEVNWKRVSLCSLLAGMHPDGATEAIIQTSLRIGVPFAILPCCFSRKLFPKRVKKNKSDPQPRHNEKIVDPYQSYSIFCQHLLEMAPVGLQFEVENLPFQGRNKVIYFSNYACQVVTQ
jgi:hypothetical protein